MDFLRLGTRLRQGLRHGWSSPLVDELERVLAEMEPLAMSTGQQSFSPDGWQYAMVRSLIILICVCAFSACTPLTPIQSGTSAAVMLEDLTEDPEQDAQEQTLLEGIDDVLSGPMNMLKAGLAANLAFFWSLGDLFTGNDVDYKIGRAHV